MNIACWGLQTRYHRSEDKYEHYAFCGAISREESWGGRAGMEIVGKRVQLRCCGMSDHAVRVSEMLENAV